MAHGTWQILWYGFYEYWFLGMVCFGMWGVSIGMWDWHACILFYSMVFTSIGFYAGLFWDVLVNM